jgi:hypothetical protein
MADLRMLHALLLLKRKGIRQIENPCYSPAAEKLGKILIADHNLHDRLWGRGIDCFCVQCYCLSALTSWQDSLFVSNLLSLAGLSSDDVQALCLAGEPATPRVVVYGETSLLCDGNHRLWSLSARGVQRAYFRSVYL